MSSENLRLCFVIMPFKVRKQDIERYYNDTNHWNEVYNGLISPAIKETGLKILRDDEDYSSRLVGVGIWSKIEKADIILCDMSAHNPNVHLELGWAMRADKKIVLIKDDLTEFSFDLNQYYTYEYSHRLQPTVLGNSIKDLSRIISETLSNDTSNYSMVNKLALQNEAIKASFTGNLEVGLLQELISEVRTLKKSSTMTAFIENPYVSLDINSKTELRTKIIGTTWRKDTGLEEIYFTSEIHFLYSSVGIQKWLENDWEYNERLGMLELTWRHDNFIAYCRFDSKYSVFTEKDGTRWLLVAKQPFIHSSFQ